MTSPHRTGTGRGAVRTSRPMRISAAAAAAALIALAAALAWSGRELYYLTPAPDRPGAAGEPALAGHAVTFVPAMIALAVDAGCLLAALGLLAWTVTRRRPARSFWPALVAVTIVSLAVTIYAAVAPRPAF